MTSLGPSTQTYTLQIVQQMSWKTFLITLTYRPFSQDQRNKLDAPITQDEISAAISSMQSGKSPGPDGLPSDF